MVYSISSFREDSPECGIFHIPILSRRYGVWYILYPHFEKTVRSVVYFISPFPVDGTECGIFYILIREDSPECGIFHIPILSRRYGVWYISYPHFE